MLKWIKDKTSKLNKEDIIKNITLVASVAACVLATVALIKSTNNETIDAITDAWSGEYMLAEIVDASDITFDVMDRAIALTDITGEIIGYALLDEF